MLVNARSNQLTVSTEGDGEKPEQQEMTDFKDLVMDMDPDTVREMELKLLPQRESAWYRNQPILDLQMIKFPRDVTDKLDIEAWLKCINCKQFPYPKDYYFCSNETGAHILCKNCFESDPSKMCPAEIAVDEDKCVASVGGNGRREQCEMYFYPAVDPLYDTLLTCSSFHCVYHKFKCNWTGPVDAIKAHATDCEFQKYARDQTRCLFTDCDEKVASGAQLLKHFRKVHQTCVVSTAGSITTICLKWKENLKDEIWVPSIIKCPNKGVTLLLTLGLYRGRLYQWLYVIGSEKHVSEICIESGFRNKKDETNLRQEILESLEVPPYAIQRRRSCFSLRIEDFIKNHLERSPAGEVRNFTFDLNIM